MCYLCPMPAYYFKAAIQTSDHLIQESLIAELADAGFDGFEQNSDTLIAYTESEAHLPALTEICRHFSCAFTSETLPAQNWNEVWESNFQPVVIPGFCAVLAPFHEAVPDVAYTIRIMPKMSFGTGHHATTSMMLTRLRDLDLNGRSVLDFGAGTGVLAILAKMLGAGVVLAIDNDDWAYENCLENVAGNHTDITVRQGSLGATDGQTFDLILANINRHILLQYMDQMGQQLNPGGQLFLSGILAEDEAIITAAAAKAGLRFTDRLEKNNWLSLGFKRC